MARTKAHRKYQLTINNPIEKGLTQDVIKTTLDSFSNCDYWCMCDEIGEQNTLHTHVYIAFRNAVEFHMIQQRFYGAHIEPAKGSHQQNRDYIRKDGKWLNDPKHETNLLDTFEESGELPPEKNSKLKQSEAILQMIQDGASNADIILEYPSAMNRIPRIEQTRQTLLEEKYKKNWRDLDVTYLWGAPGVGKTRMVMDKYGYENVYRVTNYKNPFDGYKGELVILFDEFRSTLPLADMLNYLDGYPLMLPCRFSDRVACYTIVYIVSNIPLEKQYPNVQQDEPQSYAAFLRRIHHVYKLSEDAPGMPF